ncbi:MAG TPA: sigma-70 family RNA polymerase sigma factor [Thermoanaerobaculia bacterium]|nr:sigma-70 family RNA polymerase sigma factor [Thermoanaerobaculia bacterium]
MTEAAATPPTDSELMAATRRGCRDSFGQLVDRHKDRLVAYLTRLAGSRERAEDLAQEAFLRLYQQAGRYDERGKLQGLLYSIATNLLRSEERRLRRWHLLAPFLGQPSPANGFHPEPAPSTRVLQRELEREMAAALAALPLRYRVPVVLFEIEGWTLAAIAAHLEVQEGTVKSRLHRGRQRLKQKLAPYWNEDAGARHADQPHSPAAHDGPAPRREPATPA